MNILKDNGLCINKIVIYRYKKVNFIDFNIYKV